DDVGISVVLTKHENCAGFMAEGVHHHDGAPAILVATIGPGIANAANVIANALQDRVPMIALTGCVPATQAHTYTHQVFDHVKLAEPITKAAFRVEQGAVSVIADKAVAIATEGRPGPVLLDVPIDVQTADQPIATTTNRAPLSAMVPADGVDLTAARNWLTGAKRPLVIAGIDVLNQQGQATVAAFCKALSIPLITSYKAKGIIPEDQPLSLGGAGLSPKADKHLLPLVQASDLIILAGYDPIEMRTGWQNPWQSDTRVIDISAVSNTHYMHQASINFTGDVAATLDLIREGVTTGSTWSDGEPAQTREALRAGHGLDEEWGPSAVVDECRKGFPSDTIATADSGAHRILISQAWDCYEPRGLLQSSALCTMGCAVPLAMGRKLAEPTRPVVAFVGDAGLEMFLGELATIRDLKISVPIVVFVDGSLALIELKQRGMQLPNLAVDFGETDFPQLAKAMGGEGAWCRDRESLSREVKAAQGRDTFTLLCAVIGARAYDGRI
ncbi:MAG: thiamine pyrophosphate-binding protein, partial [Rhodospirillales bacterium]|nr:thiamine pyrophosphate-binding protein [Rhodospirillales bacterium]